MTNTWPWGEKCRDEVLKESEKFIVSTVIAEKSGVFSKKNPKDTVKRETLHVKRKTICLITVHYSLITLLIVCVLKNHIVYIKFPGDVSISGFDEDQDVFDVPDIAASQFRGGPGKSEFLPGVESGRSQSPYIIWFYVRTVFKFYKELDVLADGVYS